MGKPDDCYELTLLRHYRDGWLSGQPEGEALIQTYYDTAPGIIARINTRKDAAGVYAKIIQIIYSPVSVISKTGLMKPARIFIWKW